MQATREIPLTCERVLRTFHTDLRGICGSASMDESDASSLNAAQISAVRKRCGESLSTVRGALKRATRAAASGARSQAVSAALRTLHSSGKPAWVGSCDDEHDSTPRTPWASELEAEPLQRSQTFATSHTSPNMVASAGDVPRASPLRGAHSAGQVSRARRSPSSCACPDSGSEVPAQADSRQRIGGAGGVGGCEWREAEALLAELPGRLANVAIVLKMARVAGYDSDAERKQRRLAGAHSMCHAQCSAVLETEQTRCGDMTSCSSCRYIIASCQ